MSGKTNKVKTLAPTYPVPQTRDQVNGAITRIGDLQRERARLETEMNDQIAVIKEKYSQKAAPLTQEIQARSKVVQMWCETNRPELTKEGRVKFHKFSAGEVNWRKLPAKVSIRGKDKVIQALKDAELTEYLRVIYEIDKDAIKRKPHVANLIKGISVGSEGEQFTITPFETELEEVA